MMRLIYTICSKNSMNKDFHEILISNDREFIRSRPWVKRLLSGKFDFEIFEF